MRGSERARRGYRLLLRCLPPELRRAFGRDMEQLFADRLRETEGRPAARVLLWACAAADVGRVAVTERCARAVRGTRHLAREVGTMNGLVQDLRFGVRSLMRRPGFTIAAVTTLALGIGSTVAIFSVVDSVLLQPLPYPDAERLVRLQPIDIRTGARSGAIDHPDVRLWQEAIDELDVAGYSSSQPTLTGLGEPVALQAARVTDGLMELLGYRPALGRDLRADDDDPDGARVAVVSHGFWSERLGRDPDVLGRSLTLSGEPWEIVGVAPETFDFPSGTEVWLPRRHQREGCDHGCRILVGIGKLRPGVGVEAAQERLDAVDAQLAESHPDEHRDLRTRLESLHDVEVGSVRAALWTLFAAVAMLLLVACANVANLLLVRAQQRAPEVALRATLGASRSRLLRQLVTESALLAVPAGLIGAWLAARGTDALVALAPSGLPRLDEAAVATPALGLAVALVVLVTIIFGLLPAAHLARRELAGSLGSGARTSGDGATVRSRSLLLTGEVALSLALLLGAGLLLRTMVEIRAVDLGFATEGVERFRVSVPEARYDSLGVVRFFEELEDELARLPGVRAVGAGFSAPFASGRIGTSIELLDRPPVDPADQPSADIRPSSPGYLAATGTALIRGRWFTTDDRRDGEGVAVINAAMAMAHFPDSDPVGKQLRASVSWGFEEDPVRTIVGVVDDVRASSATEDPAPAVYIPNAQFAANSMYVVLRLAPGRTTIVPEARQIVGSLDPSLAITGVERIEDAVARQHAAPRFYMILLAVFAVLALTLTAVGLYGVVAYSVSRRTTEIGIRIALGANPRDVTRMVVRQGTLPALAGVVLGLGLFVLGARLLEAMLFGVAPWDPVTVLGATGALLAVVLAATLVPARRASRIPPTRALQAE